MAPPADPSWPVLAFDAVDSTNALARRLLAEGRIARRAVVTARGQTAGRGTHDRTWLSPRDAGLYASFVAEADPDWPVSAIYTKAAGLACVEALERTTGIAVVLKPVNDLLAGGGKLGGILVETIVEAGRLRAVIIGVGINWRRAIRPLPEGHPRAVCVEELLAAAAFAQLDPGTMLAALGDYLNGYLEALTGRGAEEIERRWQAATAWFEGCA